jgi:hypothetical protein
MALEPTPLDAALRQVSQPTLQVTFEPPIVYQAVF